MKKIISLCSLVLVFALVVTVFTACGDNTKDNTTTQASEETVVTKGFSAEIGETSATVKKDGKEFQVLKYPINSGMSVDLKYASENNEFIDMNFDGVLDFYIAISNQNGVINYHCWLYNATSNQFDYSVILSALQNISVDAENHRILSNSIVGGVEHVFSYRWEEGQLKFDSDYSDENGGIPEEVTQVVSDNAIGIEKPTDNVTDNKGDKEETTKENTENKTTTKVNKPGETTTKENKPDETTTKENKPGETTTKENKPGETTTKVNKPDETTTKVNKPANTTTTAPNVNDGLVIETGNINDGWF